MSTVLLTGIAGFIGSHTAEHLLVHTDWKIVGLASFRHKGDPLRLTDSQYFDPARVTIHYHDLQGPINERLRAAIGPIDYVINMAAESHVDRSIEHPAPFIGNNVSVALNMLDWARVAKPKVFIQISTDEVYGPSVGGHNHKEWETPLPSNPYSASKACQEAIAFSYWRTYGVPVVITNTMNIFGERQDPEKFVPLVISKVLRGETVQIHGHDGVPGSRFYLHARNQADALMYLLRNYERPMYRGRPPFYPDWDRPARYHVVGEREINNLAMARLIAAYLGKPLKYVVVNFHASRPGHDLRYALDGSKLAALGWKAPIPFEESLRKTIEWSLSHPEWLDVPKEISVA